MTSIHRRRVWALILLLAVLLSGCDFRGWLFDERDEGGLGDTVSPSPSASPAIPSGPAIMDLYGLAWHPADPLDPLRDTSVFNHVLYPLVYEGLFVLDASFEPQKVLCAYVSSEENLVFAFTLRTDVTFHDGSPLTAADVAASFAQAREPASPYAASLSGIRSVAADEGTRTVTVTLDAPNARFPALCTFPIVQANNSEMGTGPYTMDRTGESPALSRYEDWWQKKETPVLHWELVETQTPDQGLSAFESGLVTVLPLDPSGEGLLWTQGTHESFSYTTAQMVYVGFNDQSAVMGQEAVRQSVALCVDRDAWIRALLPDEADKAFLPVPPEASFGKGIAVRRTEPDEIQAVSLLTEAGWADRDGDGRIDTAGRNPAPVTLRLLVSRDKPLRVSLAHSLAQALERIGWTVEIAPLAPKEFEKELAAGHFDLYIGETELNADFNPAVFLEGGALGYGRARHAELAELLATAQAVPSYQSRAAWDAFWQLWQEETVMLPVFFRRMELAAARGSLRNPTPVWGNLFYNIAQWS